MAQKQLFPVFDLPEIPDTEELEERYSPSAYFDFEKGDFVRDGAGKIKKSEGKDAYIQWCLKVVSTERYSCLAYSSAPRRQKAALRRICRRAQARGAATPCRTRPPKAAARR